MQKLLQQGMKEKGESLNSLSNLSRHKNIYFKEEYIMAPGGVRVNQVRDPSGHLVSDGHSFSCV